MSENDRDPVTGLPIVDGKVDLSSGIHLTDEERTDLRTVPTKLNTALDAAYERLAPELHPVARAIHDLQRVLPVAVGASSLIGVPVLTLPTIELLRKALEEAAKEIGI